MWCAWTWTVHHPASICKVHNLPGVRRTREVPAPGHEPHWNHGAGAQRNRRARLRLPSDPGVCESDRTIGSVVDQPLQAQHAPGGGTPSHAVGRLRRPAVRRALVRSVKARGAAGVALAWGADGASAPGRPNGGAVGIAGRWPQPPRTLGKGQLALAVLDGRPFRHADELDEVDGEVPPVVGSPGVRPNGERRR